MMSSLFTAICMALLLLATTSHGQQQQRENPQRTVVMRLEPQPMRPPFMKAPQAPRAIPQHVASPQPKLPSQFIPQPQLPQLPQLPPQAPQPQLPQLPQLPPQPHARINGGQRMPVAQGMMISTIAPPMGAQQPVAPTQPPTQQFTPLELVTPPPPPPVNIPPDVQNQLIKFFGLDSFGIPGLTGSHPNGFAGAVQELRAAGIPVQGLPIEHIPGMQPLQAPQNDALVAANPKFANELNTFAQEARSGGPMHSTAANAPLPDTKPGENGLIGLLSSSIRKLVKDTGMADALSQGIPSMLGTGGAAPGSGGGGQSSAGSSGGGGGALLAAATDSDGEKTSSAKGSSSNNVRRAPSSAYEKAIHGFATALGGGGGNSPTHAGLPRIPGIPLLPGGIPRNAQGQIDVVNLIGTITRRVSNGTTLADVLPPEQLQTLADNVTDALLPSTPDDFDLTKFMGRWFEGINSPRASEQRCVVHHYGGLTKNEKTATFTALKIYREGSEFGPVRYSIGYAFRGGNKDAMLQLHSSESSDAQPFWVYKLGPEGTDPFGNKQYEYAIVSNWVKYPVTVLVRDPDTFKTKYEVEVLRWLEDQGFINGFVRAFNLLQPATYTACQYADNTFELFGKKK